MVTYPEGRDYFTPDEMEAVKAASTARGRVADDIIEQRHLAARAYLDDGQWTVQSKNVWRRSYDGNKLMYVIDRDSYNLTYPHKNTTKGYWGKDAFNFIFEIMHETMDGFGENVLTTLQKRRPRKGAEKYGPKEELHIEQLNHDFLTSKEQRWDMNPLPPKEVLEQMVGWDYEQKLLFKISPERDTTEIVFDTNFVELNGEMYSIPRIRSVLQFGNSKGYIEKPEWRQKLTDHPILDKPLLPDPEPVVEDHENKPGFKTKYHPSRRRKLRYDMFEKLPEKNDSLEPKKAADVVFEERVAASQEQKLTREIRRKKVNE